MVPLGLAHPDAAGGVVVHQHWCVQDYYSIWSHTSPPLYAFTNQAGRDGAEAVRVVHR